MRQLPREVDPLVFNMTAEDPGDVSYASVGGLSEQIREMREVTFTCVVEGGSICQSLLSLSFHVQLEHNCFQVIELPLMNPELFQRVGITPPKGCLLYGPPGLSICLISTCQDVFTSPLLPTGTGKTLLARAVAKQLDANFLKVVSSAIVDKYIGESARLIREMFGRTDKP